MKMKFWKPQPKEPWSDWRMHSMLLPILVSAAGFFVTGIFAFAFSDIAVIPASTQSWMVIVGSALIIFGAELNTPFTTVEVFRKILRKEANAWDTSALVVSLLGTMVNLLVTFASRLTLDVAWKGVVLTWGPLLSGFAVACDYYGALVELGFLFGSYEVRMERWLEEKRLFDQDAANADAPLVDQMIARIAELETDLEKASWPQAKKTEWVQWTAGMNGRTPKTFLDAEKLFQEKKRKSPPRRTLLRWGLIEGDTNETAVG